MSDGVPDDRLAQRYRRLLACYPPEHRAVYQEEMLGVLLDTAGPERTRPTLAEAANLIGAALGYRLRRTGQELRERPWREAAAVLSVVLPALLFTVRLLDFIGATGLGQQVYGDLPRLGPTLWVPPLAWALVTLVGLAGPRLAAAALGWAAMLVELGVHGLMYQRYGWQARPPEWIVLLALTAALALTLGTGPRRGLRLLRAWRATGLAGVAAFVVGGQLLYDYYAARLPSVSGLLFWGTGPRVLAILAGAVALLRLGRPLRRRLVASIAPLAVLIAAEAVANLGSGGIPGPAAVPVVLPVLAVVTFVAGAGLVRRREQQSTPAG